MPFETDALADLRGSSVLATMSPMTLRLRLLVVALGLLAACPAPTPTPIALPGGLALDDLSPAQRELLRATLQIGDAVLDETEVRLDVDKLTLSGDVILNASDDGEHVATLRVYGRVDKDGDEVLLGQAEKTIAVKKNGEAFIDFDGVTFEDCAPVVVDGDCSIVFDANRNAVSNIDDLIAGVDPAPQDGFVSAAPETLQFASGIRTGAFSRQVVVVENTGEHPVRISRVQVAGGQGVGVSIFDPGVAVVAPPRRLLDEVALDKDADGLSDFLVLPGDEAFIAVTFAPVNSFLTTSAVQVSAVDTVTGVQQATRTKVIANADGSLRQRDPTYVEPALGVDSTIALPGTTLPARVFPAAQLFSGGEVSSFDSADNPGLQSKGQALIVGDFAMPADGAFVVDIAPGTRFSAAIAGLSSDVDLAIVGLDAAGAATEVLGSSRQAGTSAEAVDLVNTGDVARRVAVVLGRVDETPPAALAGALSLDVRAPFRLTCQLTRGPELEDVDPVTPDRGPLEGGTTVRLRGRGFFVPAGAAGPHVRISFNGFAALGTPTIATADDGVQTVTTLLPPGAVSSADLLSTIVVENPASGVGENADGQAATLPEAFRYDLPAPRLNRVTPDAASTDGGDLEIVVTGAFFFDRYGPPVVDFGGAAGSALVVDASTLLVTPPPHAEGLALITVRNIVASGDEGEPSNGVPFFYRTPTLPAPTLTAIDVDEGSADGGTVVVLAGSNFAPGARVFFGSAEATVQTNDPASLTVVTRRVDDAGVVDVVVQNTDGQTARLAEAFTFVLGPPTVDSVFPARASVDGGASVVVRGSGFRVGASVSFVDGDVVVPAVNVIFSSSTTLVVTTPTFAAAGAATLVVENVDLQRGTVPFDFFVPAGSPPRIVTIDPAFGDVAGGAAVSILGSDLVDPVVAFGDAIIDDVLVEPAANGLQRIVVTSPPGSAGAALVTVVNGDGQSDSIAFTYVDRGEPRIIAASPAALHAEIVGDEILIFGERLSLLGQARARAIVAGEEFPLALTAIGDTLARIVVTTPLPASNSVVIQLVGENGEFIAAPAVVARRPDIARIDATSIGPNVLRLLMIGDNLAGDRLTRVIIRSSDGEVSTECINAVADERLLTCEAEDLETVGPPVIELQYGDAVVVDNNFIVDNNNEPVGGGPRLTNARAVIWPDRMAFEGEELGGVTSMVFTWLTFDRAATLESVTFGVAELTVSPTAIEVASSTRLAPGLWRACAQTECIEMRVDPPENEIEPNNAAVAATGIELGRPQRGLTKTGETDLFFFRPVRLEATTHRIEVKPDFAASCGEFKVRFDGGSFVTGSRCAPVIVTAEFADVKNHIVEVGNDGAPIDIGYSVSVQEVVAPPIGCPNGIVEPGEDCDNNIDGTCDAFCREVDEPGNNSIASPSQLFSGQTRRTLTPGDNDNFAIDPLPVVVTLSRQDGPCGDLVMDLLNDDGSAVVDTALPEAGACGVFRFNTASPTGIRLVRVVGRSLLLARYTLAVQPPGGTCPNSVVDAGEDCDEGFSGQAGCDNLCREFAEPDSLAVPRALAVGQFSGATLPPGDVDFFQFDLAVPSTLAVSLFSRDGGCGPGVNVEVVDAANQVEASLANGADGCTFDVVPLLPGSHFIRVATASVVPLRYDLFAQLNPIDLTPGLVARYKAGIDQVRNGPLLGSPSPFRFFGLSPDRFGAPAALDFTEGSSFAEAVHPALPLGNAPRTLSAWVNLPPLSQEGQIAGWGAAANESRFALVASGEPARLVFRGGSADIEVAGPPIADDNWHHVVATYDGSVVTIYVDGVRIDGAPRALSTAENTLTVGRSPAGVPPAPLPGLVDDVRVWNRPLSDVEVALLFAEPPDSCGNGVVSGVEACDDGNFVNGDGCSVCTVDFGATCGAAPSDCAVPGAPFTLRSAASALEITEIVPDGQWQLNSFGQGLIEIPSVDGGATTVSLAVAGDPARRVLCPIGGAVFLCVGDQLSGEPASRASFNVNVVGTGLRYRSAFDDALLTARAGDLFVDFGGGEDVWNRFATCGNGFVEAGEECDDANREFGDGCSPSCKEEDSFCTGTPSQCLPMFCQSFSLQSAPGTPLQVTGGAFDIDGFSPLGRVNPLTSQNLNFPVKISVDVSWFGTDIAFVGVRSDGQPVPLNDEPTRSIYLRLHNGIGVDQADLNAENVVLDTGFTPAPSFFTPYRVTMRDDGSLVSATVDGQGQRTSLAGAASSPTADNRLVLSGVNVSFANLEVCQGL